MCAFWHTLLGFKVWALHIGIYSVLLQSCFVMVFISAYRISDRGVGLRQLVLFCTGVNKGFGIWGLKVRRFSDS